MNLVAVQSAVFTQSHVIRKFSPLDFMRENAVALNIISLIVVGCLVAIYIVQVNATISKGYQIRDLETQVNELTLMNQKLELETHKSQSLDHVAQSVKMLGFVQAGMPTYVDSSGASFAFAQ